MPHWVTAPHSSGLYEMTECGRFRRVGGDRELKPVVRANGYAHVEFFFGSVGKKKLKKQLLVHRLIAEVFIPRVPGKNCVNHRDGNKLNNAIDNLEWCTKKENNLHAHRSGLAASPNKGPGRGSPAAKLTDLDVLTIRQILEDGAMSHAELGQTFGVSRSTISNIAVRKTWYHI